MTWLLQGRCGGIAPFTVTVGRAAAWETGLVCPVRPGTSCASSSRSSRRRPGGRFGSDPPAYCPHLTLAFAVAHI
jgi:hypothetical protein